MKLLIKLFIANPDDLKNPEVRRRYGVLSGALGIALNILLFIGKYVAGVISGSIAATADAFNNLSDAGSSAVSLIGFKLSGRRPDPEHPFGHGRLEYISGLIVSMLIIVMGYELGMSSVDAILHPEKTHFSLITVIILSVSVLVKLYMALYNRKYGKKIDSPSMLATCTDSLCDCVATVIVLICTLISLISDVCIDGYAGLAVAVFILISGFKAGKETIEPLLGLPPEKEFVDTIEEIVMGHHEIIGIHDLVVHNYGPGRTMISLHAEVPADGDVYQLHEIIDDIEKDLFDELGSEAVIHMDPIDVNNEKLNVYKALVTEKLIQINDEMTLHDFRMVPGKNHTNLIFDVVVPFGCKLSHSEILNRLSSLVQEDEPKCNVVINFDTPFVNKRTDA